MNGLALLAAQAQAASTKNPTPVHSEDPQQRRSGVLSQTARRGSSRKPRRPYGRKDGYRNGQGEISVHVQVHDQHEAGMPWDTHRAAQGSGMSQGDEPTKPLDNVERRRLRPIPLPPPSSSRFAHKETSSQVGAGDTATAGGERTKPFSMPLPTLESKAPMTPTPGTVESAAAESQSRDPSRSPKRRRIDHTPEHVGLISSNITRGSVITNKSPQSTRVPTLPLSPASTHFAEARTSEDHVASPGLPPKMSPLSQIHTTVKVKNEPESPPPPSVERKAVSSQFQFFPFPDDCKKMDTDWLTRRINFKKEAERELKAKGFKVGEYVVRGDGISIEWRSPVPVWNDTLEPVSPASLEGAGRSRADTDSSMPLAASQSKKGISSNSTTAISTPPVSRSRENAPFNDLPATSTPPFSQSREDAPFNDLPGTPTPRLSRYREDVPFNDLPAKSAPPVSSKSSPQKLASHQKSAPQLTYNNLIIPPSPALTTSTSPKPRPKRRQPPAAFGSPATIPALASTPSNVSPPKQKRKPRTSHVPCGELDLATAIRLSQRDNASPRSPPRRQTVSSSSRSTRSPAVKRLPSLSPSLSKLAYDSSTKAPRTVPSGLARETRFAEDEVEVVHVGNNGGREEGKNDSPATGAKREAVLGLGQASGWTVIQEIVDPDRSDGTEERVEEEHDQLEVEDEEDELRNEMEAAGAVSIGTKDESGDERDEVENAAILNGQASSPTMTEMVLPEVVPTVNETTADIDMHDLARNFLTKYMLMYETDRAQLISAYAPNAKLIYRVSEPPPAAAIQAKTSSFPLRSARGHDEISKFLDGLGWTHFAQRLDEGGNKEVDLEFQSERLDQGVWLYVRSVMTVDDVQEPSESDQVNRWSVDHSFLLHQGTSESAMGDRASTGDTWPLIAHVHQLMMHESTL